MHSHTGRMTCYCRLIFAKGLLSFKRQRGTPMARRLPYGSQKVSTKQRNKAFSGRKPFYGNTVSSADSSSVWERSVVVVANRVREDVGRRSEVRSVGRQERINRTDNGAIQRTLNKSQKKERRREWGKWTTTSIERTVATRHLLLTSLSDRQNSEQLFLATAVEKVAPSIDLSIQRVS